MTETISATQGKEIALTSQPPDLVLRQGTSGSPFTDAADMTFEDVMTAFAQGIGSTSLSVALRQAAFLLCCTVIAQDTAKAKMEMFDISKPNTSRKILPSEHPVAFLLHTQPNARHTWFEYSSMIGFWTAAASNGFAIVERNMLGEPLELIPIQWGRVLEVFDRRQREPSYEVTAGSFQEESLLGASSRIVLPGDSIHIRRNMVDGMDGFSILTAGKDVLAVGKAIADYREQLFAEDAQTRGVFQRTLDGALPDLAFQRLKQQLGVMMRRFQANNEPIILEGGLKFEPIAVSPKDAELNEQFGTSIIETARLFRIPPHKVFQLENVKYDNMEAAEKIYVSDTMEPLLQESDQRHSAALLTRQERRTLTIRHDRRAFILRDTKAETERVTRLIERGIMTFDEARQELGYNPVEGGGGNTRMIPANMQLIDGKNKVVLAASQSGGLGGKPGPDQTQPAAP